MKNILFYFNQGHLKIIEINIENKYFLSNSEENNKMIIFIQNNSFEFII
jgi:hypothetical protein